MTGHGLYRRIWKYVLPVLCCTSLSAFGANTLTLKLDSASLTIKSALYGGLLENFGRDIYYGLYVGVSSKIPNTRGMRNDIIKGMREAGLQCLEWPGGCYADNYNWRNGIADVQTSRTGGEFAMGLGTREYFQLNDSLGSNAEGYIAVNVQSDSAAGAAAWLTYIDTNTAHPEWKSRLKYYKIGNEEWGSCGNMTAASYEAVVDKYLAAIPTVWKSKLTTIMDGGSGGGWISTHISKYAGKIGGISLHSYAVSNWSTMDGASYGFDTTSYKTKLTLVNNIGPQITGFENTMLTSDPNYTVALMVDEWGIWSAAVSNMGGSFNQSTVREAVATGMYLNTFNNHCKRVQMALSAQPVDAINSLFLTRNNTTDTVLIKTPTFYVYKMYKVHQKAKMVPTTLAGSIFSGSMLSLSASASIDSLSMLHLSLTNANITKPETLTVTLSSTSKTYQSVTGQIVTGPSFNSMNGDATLTTTTETVNLQTFDNSNFTLTGNSLKVILPPHCVITLALTPTGGVGVKPTAGSTVVSFSRFSINPMIGGKVNVNYSVAAATPFTLALYGTDGRLCSESFAGVMEPGHQSLVWQPKNKNGCSCYYLKKAFTPSTSDT